MPFDKFGKLTVITGPMKSGKTLQVILKAYEAEASGRNVISFHPTISSRWGKNEIHSRLKVGEDNEEHRLSFPSTPIDNFNNFINSIPLGTDLVVFDDAQFFSSSIVEECRILRKKGIDVYISGLDMDSLQHPFGPMPMLMAIADKVIKTTAYCEDCGDIARTTYREVNDGRQILIGDKEYRSLCYSCWDKRKSEEEITF